jgi:hypothetical protein
MSSAAWYSSIRLRGSSDVRSRFSEHSIAHSSGLVARARNCGLLSNCASRRCSATGRSAGGHGSVSAFAAASCHRATNVRTSGGLIGSSRTDEKPSSDSQRSSAAAGRDVTSIRAFG